MTPAGLADGPAWRHRRPWYDFSHLTTAIGVAVTLAAGLAAHAGDILRGGAPAGTRGGPAVPGALPPQAQQTSSNAKDALARTSQAIQSVKAMQKAAREAAANANNLGLNPRAPGQMLPNVRDGLAPGGLQVAPAVPKRLNQPTPGEDPSLWRGATLPQQSNSGGRTNVTIRQTESQAVLTWQTFNVGKNTTLKFDQSAGKERSSEWVAFNKVQDPSGRPSQILGSIQAEGQVYVVNQNGIIFGGASQVNARSFVASALPINDNLIQLGLLNNPDAQFLFSALPVPGGTSGTPAFFPKTSDPGFTPTAVTPTYTFLENVALTKTRELASNPQLTYAASNGSRVSLIKGQDYDVSVDPVVNRATVTFKPAGLAKLAGAQVTATYAPAVAKSGDITVQAGASLFSTVSNDGNGGRVMLAGANVTNAGTISTQAGQTILAAGLQVGVAAHASNDPSLRGLDTWVGAVGDAGTVTNTGLIEALTGSAAMHGRYVDQLGVIESSTSVDLNGRIDLRASYDAVGNPKDPNPTSTPPPPFIYQKTGVVRFGIDSVTRILPDYASDSTTPGTTLPEKSQINVEGRAIHMGAGAMMMAPNADVTFRAGVWPYVDVDGNRTTLNENLNPPARDDPNFSAFTLSGAEQRFLFSTGQIYLDPAALVTVAGSTDVFVPLAHSILDVEFRGAEFADAPVQRNGPLRATSLTIDIRRTGVLDGRYWMGTPLGDATGLAGLIQRNAAQLTAAGGNVTFRAGGSIVVSDGARIDVSGGSFQHEGGMVSTTRLLQQGRLIDIADARPDQVYDGVFTGQFVVNHPKYGLSETYTIPFLNAERFEPGYIEGAAGGSLSLTAPTMVLDGELLGHTTEGPRQRSERAEQSRLTLNFEAQRVNSINQSIGRAYIPPTIVISAQAQPASVPAFTLQGDAPSGIGSEREKLVTLSPGLLKENGFGHLIISNPDGEIIVPEETSLEAPVRGSISLTGSNVTIRGSVTAHAGQLTFRALNLSPRFVEDFTAQAAIGAPPTSNPPPNIGRGSFTLAAGARLDASGLLVDDRPESLSALAKPIALAGGTISVESFSADIAAGSSIDVSGGARLTTSTTRTFGNGGSISILTGRDLTLTSVTGGELELAGTLSGYSGATGGSLSLRAMLIQVGGTPQLPDTLVVRPEFFRTGGFTSYSLTGLGLASPAQPLSGGTTAYIPAILVASGTTISPVAESFAVNPREPGANEFVLNPVLREVGLRSPVSLSLTALGWDDQYTLATLEARGDLVIEQGARIETDPRASIALEGGTVTVLGSLSAPGGAIAIKGASIFPGTPLQIAARTLALPTVHIGSTASISTAGTTILSPDAFDRRIGTVTNGGTITVYGNIVAEKGAVLDVSGTSAILDLTPVAAGQMQSAAVSSQSGINSAPERLKIVPTLVDSNGGLVELEGAQMLLSDATLIGRAGGPTSGGGTLSIHSGRFYPQSATGILQGLVTNADINLVVTQSGDVVPVSQPLGVGRPVLSASGTPVPSMGYFAVDRFTLGGFDSLELGAKFFAAQVPGSQMAGGGNIEFRGPVSIEARGSLLLAAGGVIKADAAVSVRAPYIAIGQPFDKPLNPADSTFVFQQSVSGSPLSTLRVPPTFGTGTLAVDGSFVDLGTLTLQNIGRASLRSSGDIRGNGTVVIQGDLTLQAAQIYPTTLGTLNLAAYDRAGGLGSITILAGGTAAAPMSVGGSINIFATHIVQAGVLKAPLGSITIGWDGRTDYDRTDADIDAPTNFVVGTALPPPKAALVTLATGSLTSVSAIDTLTGAEMLLPFGLSPDGFSWIDPRGVDITSNGLPGKQVLVMGEGVTMATGAVVDLRGGGDLYAYRKKLGNGGSADRLGTASSDWSAIVAYKPGDLALFNGQTWTARVASTGRQPAASLYWSQVAESFAILPGYSSPVAPINPYNTGAASTQLQGDPGYIFTPNQRGNRIFSSLASVRRVDTGLQVGDQIHLSATPGLSEGTYTLLPRRYALLPGAFLVTPQTGEPLGTITFADGATTTTGYLLNSFKTASVPEAQTRFEVASSAVTRSRAEYENFFGNAFFSEAADRLEISRPQPLPRDAGYALFHGNTGLSLEGQVLTARPATGRGASIDISSFANMYLTEGATAPAGSVVLHPSILSSWGAESLLVGGVRRLVNDQMTVEVRTNNLVLDNPGSTFAAPEIILASRAGLTLTAGSSIAATGAMSQSAERLFIVGDGTMLRVNTDGGGAALTRTGVTGSTLPLMEIGAGASISGVSVNLDSTYGTRLDPSISLQASVLTLGSGQISIVLDPSQPLTGSTVTPHLVLSGQLLTDVTQVASLTLRSYRAIDLYGAGTFGGPSLGRVEFLASGLRGYGQDNGTFAVQAGGIAVGNPNTPSAAPPTPPPATSGSIAFNANTVNLGAGDFSVAGYNTTTINAPGGLLGTGDGTFSVSGDLTINTSLIAGARNSTHSITANGAVVMNHIAAKSTIQPELGASFTFTGDRILANTSIYLPSGLLTLRARTGDVVVGGALDVAGTTQEFYDLIRYTDAGSITLTSDTGNVELLTGSSLTVAGSGLSKAGLIDIRAAQGSFLNQGTLLGSASEEAHSGSFYLDVFSTPDYAVINDPLQTGGFFKEHNIRVRTGAVTISGTTRALSFTLSADAGPITVTGTIDTSGATGGKINLVSGGSLTLESGALLTVHATDFSSAGKGGSIALEAGAAIDGSVDSTAMLNLLAGSVIDLGVDSYVAGDYTDPLSSAFRGKFQGTLHLRAPRLGNDVQIGTLAGEIQGASAILAEAFRVYEVPAGTFLAPSFRDTIRNDAANFMNAGYATMEARLLAAHPEWQSTLVIAPGVEIFSRGDLVLGSFSDDYTYDWDLSGFRFGPKGAPGVLTLRAKGNLEFRNALSDGFAGDFSPNDFGDVPQPGQELWLRPLMDIKSTLPTNLQSWSYRLVAGADLNAADFRQVRPLDELNAAGTGSMLIGKFYPANLVEGPFATTAEAINNRFQVVRTGTGSIDIAAGRDVQLRNPFATVYTAGVRIPYSNSIVSESEVRFMSIFAPDDFAVPLVELASGVSHPDQGILGAVQQAYAAQYAMAGGNLTIEAQRDIVRYGVTEGQIDSSRQLPNNWLYRRGYVDPETGRFGNGAPQGFTDISASTTWWVDYSSFFQGFGALGGGDVALLGGRDIINADAVSATNARMPGRDAATGENLAPDASKLLELGGGNITIRAGNNIDGGVYYTERGEGSLYAGGEIKTNAARTPSLGNLSPFGGPEVLDSLAWLPTTLFVGKSQFEVTAAGNILLGPVANPFLLPQGINNKYWYKTFFNTYSEDAGVTVSSFGGSVTHRFAVAAGANSTLPALQAYLANVNVLTPASAASYQPWIRLAETVVTRFDAAASVGAPTLRSTAFAGDVNLVGTLNLFPSSKGTVEIAASGEIIGLQPAGTLAGSPVKVWTSSLVNLSDADPARLPGITSPIAYQNLVGAGSPQLSQSLQDPFFDFRLSFLETGSFSGNFGTIEVKQALHGDRLLHAEDFEPVRLYALDGDITGLLLFTPKATQIAAGNDITDVSFYIQHSNPESISYVSAGRDIIPFSANTDLRTVARDPRRGNTLSITESRTTVTNTSITSLPGDLQISGQGVLEVLAGRNLDLGTGPNLSDGTAVGIASIGNARNPTLPVQGADLIVFAGVAGAEGAGPALGLSGSALDFDAFGEGSTLDGLVDSEYLKRLDLGLATLESLTPEQQAIVSLERFYGILRDTGRNSTTSGFTAGFSAISTLFGSEATTGEIFTRAKDIRTATGGAISIAAPGGGLTMASDIFGNPLTPPGVVTEFGGTISMFTNKSVEIGQARIFTLRGGDILIWSSTGNIAAGTAPKTVVTAPPTRVLIDATSAAVQTDLGGLATGGGIGVLAAVKDVPPGDVDLIAPVGFVDAGDAGIRSTGNLSIAAVAVLNASNIQVAGTSSGVPSAAPPPAVNLGAITSASNTATAGAAGVNQVVQSQAGGHEEEMLPSIIVVEVMGFTSEEEEEKRRR